MLHAADHIQSGVLAQLAASVRRRTFVSALGAPEYDYSAHYERIVAPLLVILGGRDRIANAAVTREVFFERISSRDKELLEFEQLAHGEFAYTLEACRCVYPAVLEWLVCRRSIV